MKFIHAADIHLDSPLSGLASYQDAPAELLRAATRDAFTKLVDEAINQRRSGFHGHRWRPLRRHLEGLQHRPFLLS